MTTKSKELTEQQAEYDTNSSVALVPFEPKDVTPIHGVNIPANWTFEQKLEVMQHVSEMIDGKSDKIDDYINQVIWVQGVLQHDVIVNNSNNQVTNRQTGEIAEYVDAVRSVMLVVGTQNELFDSMRRVHVTSIAATRYFQTRIIPLFGALFEKPLPLRFRIVNTGKGRTYSIEIPKNAVLPTR